MADNAVLARNTDNAPKSDTSSQTVAFSHYNHLSAQLPIDASGTPVAGGAKEQAEQALANIKAIVESIDLTMDDVVRINTFVTDIADLDAVDEAFKGFFTTHMPARTTVGVAALPQGAKVAVEAVVANGVGTIPDAPQAGDLVIVARNTDKAPKNDLSSQTVAFSHYNNISAQLPIDPETGKLVEGGIEEQTAQALQNVKTILESIEVPLDDIVKVTLFVKNLSDIEAVDRVYKTFLPDSAIARAVGYLPARTVVAASALPMDALVQVEAVVSHGDGTPPQEVEDRHGIVIEANDTDAAPIDPMSTQSVAFSHYNNISAQLPVDASGALVSGGIEEQAKQCLTHIATILESVEHSADDVVKVNVFLTDIANVDAVAAVIGSFFTKNAPAVRFVGVSELPSGALVQIDAVAGNAEGTPPQA